MVLYGVYGNHTTEACPVNNLEVAKKIVAFAESDIQPLVQKYKINHVGQFRTTCQFKPRNITRRR